ncbi:chromosomal replication initiator protein DnaA [Mycoplasma sp. NEAQ87857]|uniref:helix-turn-helix domain-containing protein n=1 Tax=Mycoplasma sp. NEAQ87857 TaxID=2683967 RepID=UPI001316C4EC|nr:DnaA/Hda family protein [Mycoplasma sp. NEAQ87857]QGZ97185.1 chromosomal replication initiator protein DnaA [Mycoplasma sp. NEAQ87857]
MNKMDSYNLITNNQNNLNSFTEELKDFLKNEILDNMIYQSFIKKMQILQIDDKNILIYIPTQNSSLAFFKKSYSSQIKLAIKSIFGANKKYEIVNQNNQNDTPKDEAPKSFKSDEKINIFHNEEIKESNKPTFSLSNLTSLSKLNSDYTFDNLIKLNFNREAVSVCEQICSQDSDIKLILISSNSGLGKTHLLSSCINFFKNKGKSYIFIDSHNFSLEIAPLLQENNQSILTEIINAFSSVDILGIDDFQVFGEGQKKATKNFISKIIDNRLQSNKTTILTSSKSFKDLLEMFDNRLSTRLSSGFYSYIEQPSKDEMGVILEFLLNKSDIEPQLLDVQSRNFIIKNHSGSINSLSGAINRIKFYKDQLNKNNSYEVILEAFKNIVKDTNNVSPESIIKEVAKYYNVNIKEVVGKTRISDVVLARHISMNLIHQMLKLTSVEIGKIFNRDHSTVLNAFKKYKNADDKKSWDKVMEIIEERVCGIS